MIITYEIKGFKQDEKLKESLSFFADGGKIECYDSFPGCLLDNYLYTCGKGIAAVYEIFVNSNLSGYKVLYTEDERCKLDLQFDENKHIYEYEQEQAEREYMNRRKKRVKAVKAINTYKDYSFFMEPETHTIYTHNTMFPLFLEYKQDAGDGWTYEEWISYNKMIDLLIPAKTFFARVAED